MEMNFLRNDRDELPVFHLNEPEKQERDLRNLDAQRFKAEGPSEIPPCARRQRLLAKFELHQGQGIGHIMEGPEPSSEDLAADLGHQEEARKVYRQLQAHQLHCPYCTVFPALLPYMKEANSGETTT
jgi:hypothetical protein